MISAEHIRNIFDRFYKIDMHHAGSGIGLSLCKQIMNQHGGNISVYSEAGKGSCFTLQFS